MITYVWGSRLTDLENLEAFWEPVERAPSKKISLIECRIFGVMSPVGC